MTNSFLLGTQRRWLFKLIICALRNVWRFKTLFPRRCVERYIEEKPFRTARMTEVKIENEFQVDFVLKAEFCYVDQTLPFQVFRVLHDLLSTPKCVTRNKQNNYQLPVLLKIHVGMRDLIFSCYNWCLHESILLLELVLLFLSVIILIKGSIFRFGKDIIHSSLEDTYLIVFCCKQFRFLKRYEL